MVRKKSVRQRPLVSINIRTFNSAKTLAETLDSVRKQTYPKTEIVISDGYSRDNSVEIARKYGAVITYAKQLGDARYKVFKNSRGEYALSLDSDQVMDKNLIEECIRKSQKYNYDALIISEKSFLDKDTFLERLITYDKYLIDKDRKGNKLFDTACPRFFKKSVLLSVDWPKKLSIFDDTILYAMLRKFGAKIGYLKRASIWHHEVGSWKVLFKKFYRYGKGYFKAFRVSPKVVAFHSFPRRSYFSKYVLRKPQYLFPLFFLYLVKVLAALSGALASVIESFFAKLKRYLNLLK